jgi:hypothetical protein
MPDGTLVRPEKGTPQGSVVSPILANRFLHYAFDRWMKENHSEIPFERYADDATCHCRDQVQAQTLRNALAGAAGGVQVGTAPAQDSGRVLQGLKQIGPLSDPAIRLSGPYVSAPSVDEPNW